MTTRPRRTRAAAPGRPSAASPQRASAASPRRPSAASPRPEVFTLRDLAQVRALANPLRLRILETFCAGERTTKQVAEALGEPPTRLYHHVEALVRVGLLRLKRTSAKRGTVEKYFEAVARTFRADARLLAAGAPSKESRAVLAMATRAIEETAREVRGLMEEGRGEARLADEGVLSFLEIHSSKEDMARLRRRLLRLLEAESRRAPTGTGDERRFRLTVAFYPLDVGEARRPKARRRPSKR